MESILENNIPLFNPALQKEFEVRPLEKGRKVMFDTIVIYSPYLEEEITRKIEKYCIKMEGKIIETNEILYSFTRSELEGSFDYRIRINIIDYEWSRNRTQKDINGKQKSIGVPMKIPIDRKYIRVECSLHKLLLGHNVIGGPERLKSSIKYLVRFLEKTMNVKLPQYEYWTIDRVDCARVYDLQKIENVVKLMHQLKHMHYPRRKEPYSYCGGLYFKGDIDTVKFYAKYFEFRKHDYRRIKKYCRKKIDLIYEKRTDNDESADRVGYYQDIIKDNEELLRVSKGILRIEVEIKKKKLEELFESECEYELKRRMCIRKGLMIRDVIESKLIEYYDSRMDLLFKNVEVNEMINNSLAVRERLLSMYNTRKGNALYGTWFLLATHGKEKVKEMMKAEGRKATFYRHIKDLEEAAIGWDYTDVRLQEMSESHNPLLIFADMLRNKCLEGEDYLVEEKLNAA